MVARVQNSNERSGYLLFLNLELDWDDKEKHHFVWRNIYPLLTEASSRLAQVVARVQNSNERSGYLLFLNFELVWDHFLWRKPSIRYLNIYLLLTEAGSRLAQVVARADQQIVISK